MALGYRLLWSDDFISRVPPAVTLEAKAKAVAEPKTAAAVPAPLKPTSAPTFLPTYVTTIQDTTSGTKEGHVPKEGKEEEEESGEEEEESGEEGEEFDEEESEE